MNRVINIHYLVPEAPESVKQMKDTIPLKKVSPFPGGCLERLDCTFPVQLSLLDHTGVLIPRMLGCDSYSEGKGFFANKFRREEKEDPINLFHSKPTITGTTENYL